MTDKLRCSWVTEDPLYQAYHDEEWGVPSYDDRYLFEMLTLEGAQAGLSWLMILKRRENYRRAFENFEAEKISEYGPLELKQLLQNKAIIRNELKLRSVITNAQAFLELQREFGSFSDFVWAFVDHEPRVKVWRSKEELPSFTEESILLSDELKRRGFKFVGPRIMYAFMQAVGMVVDHEEQCFLANR